MFELYSEWLSTGVFVELYLVPITHRLIIIMDTRLFALSSNQSLLVLLIVLSFAVVLAIQKPAHFYHLPESGYHPDGGRKLLSPAQFHAVRCLDIT